MFSFNNVRRLPSATGWGRKLPFEARLVVTDPSLSPPGRSFLARTGPTSPYYTHTAEALAKHSEVPRTRPGASCRRLSRARSSMAPAARRSPSSMTTGCAPSRPRSRSRASSTISSGAGRRQIRPGCARNWGGTSRITHAKPVMDSALSRRRWR